MMKLYLQCLFLMFNIILLSSVLAQDERFRPGERRNRGKLIPFIFPFAFMTIMISLLFFVITFPYAVCPPNSIYRQCHDQYAITCNHRRRDNQGLRIVERERVE